jgi:hypothetical protein
LQTAGKVAVEKAAREVTPADPADEVGDLDPETLAELQQLARSRPRSGREAAAKASAIRTLERLTRGNRQIPPCPLDWHPHAGTKWEKLDKWHLERHPEVRQRWWENLWREGRV